MNSYSPLAPLYTTSLLPCPSIKSYVVNYSKFWKLLQGFRWNSVGGSIDDLSIYFDLKKWPPWKYWVWNLDRAVELTIAPSYHRFVVDRAIDGAMAMERWCDGSIKHCAIVIARSSYRHRVIASWSLHHRVIVITPSHHRVIVIASSLSRHRTIALEVDSTIAR